ncbi:hypothetical protein NM680_19295 [Paracoccus sp. PS-1]|uniref:hypothetical protein n=1 Tax=unclassified Paracoccus (in: a-proteobacteria) TaxID=2688777 RepID=UPI000491A291|nr:MULTISPECIES: hypothetical protein [unclassified Paracoccus (in: a-proteobacteria)]MDQ7263946.1 hypothetical protein [Paracoccus sp. PS1]
MTIHSFSAHRLPPRAQIEAQEIDALLDRVQPDEWLPTALRGPILLGLLATAGALLIYCALVVVPFSHGQVQASRALWIILIWGTLCLYSLWEMHRLRRARARID